MIKNEKATNKTILMRGRLILFFLLICLCFLIYRLADLQIINAEENRNAAATQYTTEITINAKRGNIYDRNMKILATSGTVQTVFISPADIKPEQVELIADGLSRLLGVDKNDIIEKCKKTHSKYQVIKKNVEEDDELKVRDFISENDLYLQVCMEESTKRYYPYGTLASQIIGFVGADNIGLSGIELTYDQLLSGVNGRAIQGRDGNGNQLPFQYETYIDPSDGSSAILTLDQYIQSVLEKYLKECVEVHKPTYGARGIIMNVDTGEILAAASIGDYDLNNYTELSDYYLEKYNAYEGSEEEKEAYKKELMNEMWKNKVATELYEPGSTFKIITTAIGLEEGIFTPDTIYNCSQKIDVLGTTIHCHSVIAHGDQTVKEALVNSCNPAFVQMALDIGGDLFSKYFKQFGYTERTGADVVGEAKSIYYADLSNQLTLANCGFGQSMAINMLQHISAVSTVANGGYLVTPHVVKGYVSADGSIVNYDYSSKRSVISKKTADTVLGMLVNSTKNASVSGYNISSKTGTSQKLGRANAEDGVSYYISSCVSFAPAEDPAIAILIVADEPTGSQIYGSQVVAPYISSVLSEVLPYLEIYPEDDAGIKTYKVEDYYNADIERVKYSLESEGFSCIVVGKGNVVVDQLPRVGTQITQNGTIILYTENNYNIEKVVVKNLQNMTPNEVFEWAKEKKVNITVEGIYNKDYNNCYAIAQSVPKGESVTVGSVIHVSFKYKEDIQ